jgi:hypothetical protein
MYFYNSSLYKDDSQKSGLITGVASLEMDSFVVFYTPNVSEISPDKRVAL